MCARQSDASHRFAHIEEILQGEVIGLFCQSSELAHLAEPFVYLAGIGRKRQLVYFLTSQRAQASLVQQCPNVVKSYLVFVVFRINHGAKVLILSEK